MKILGISDIVTKECMKNSDRIKAIGLMRAGYENVELEAANDKSEMGCCQEFF